jgi:glyoxylase-like metal-dependent hydrolase (beta-lactamase superfamily II)
MMEVWTTPEGITITCLQDGATTFGADVFPQLPDDRRLGLLARAGQTAALTRFNAFLLTGPGVGVTLVDCGAGGLFGPVAGQLAGHLTALGIARGDVTRLVLTHLHTDHCGGALRPDGAAIFHRAQVVLQADEAAFWQGKDAAGGRLLAAYADRLSPVTGAADLGAGLVCWPLPGHTTGHMGLMVGAGAALIGDVVHAEHLQLPDPAIATRYDTDQDLARASRLTALQAAAAQGLVIGGGHLLEGLGRFVVHGSGFARDDKPPES